MDTAPTTPTAEKSITIDVPEDRVAEFYALYARFLAGVTRRGRRGRRHGGPGRHGHGPHHCGPGRHEGHGEHPCRSEERSPAETDAVPAPAAAPSV